MTRAIAAGGLYFLIVFGLGFVLGALRTWASSFGLDRDMLVLAEIPAMLVFAWWAAGVASRRLRVSAIAADRFVMGLTMFGLLRVGEGVVGVALMRIPLSEQIAALATARGMLELAPQVLCIFFPLLRLRWAE